MDSFAGMNSVQTNERTRLLDKKSTPHSSQSTHKSDAIPSLSILSCAMICVLFTALLERLAFYGVSGNLFLFATDSNQLNLTATVATITVYIFKGTCVFFLVLAGWLADSKYREFSVILYGIPVYLIGVSLILLGSISDADTHVSWAALSLTTNILFKRAVYMSGLCFVAFGVGAIKANLTAFGADQISHGSSKAVERFFLWYYWLVNIGALIAFTFLVYIQQEISYFYGYLVSVICISFALVIFVAGRKSYHLWLSLENNLSTASKIFWNALKTSRLNDFSGVRCQHWLDRAKRSFGGSYSSCQVDDVKKVYRLVPIFCSMIMYWTIYAQISASMLYQGEYMNIKMTSGFQIPIASLTIFKVVSVLVSVPIMDRLVYPLLARCNISFSQLQRIGIGMIIAILSMVYSGVLELYRKEQCCQSQERGTNRTATMVSNITIFYQVPQYFLFGVSEVFTGVTGQELTYVETPKYLQAVVMGIFTLSQGMGFYNGAALVAIVNAITGARDAKEKWYPEENYINDGKLENYFFLLAALMLVNFILYIFVARNFTPKNEAEEFDISEDIYSTSLPQQNEEISDSPTPVSGLI